MRDQTSNPTMSPTEGRPTEAAARQAPVKAAGQVTVASSLLDAAMEVDAARDEGGLGLQEALFRLHEELGPFVAGEPKQAGGTGTDRVL